MEAPAYYNTNRLSGDALQAKVKSALSQEQWVMIAFSLYKKLSPSRAHRLISKELLKPHHKRWPITSTRRAITNLMKRKVLKKTEDMRDGDYGTPEHIYELIN